jgi:hypothetical protein
MVVSAFKFQTSLRAGFYGYLDSGEANPKSAEQEQTGG